VRSKADGRASFNLAHNTKNEKVRKNKNKNRSSSSEKTIQVIIHEGSPGEKWSPGEAPKNCTYLH